MALMGGRNAEDFWERLHAAGVTHIVLGPADFLYVSAGPARLWETIAAAVRSSPGKYAFRSEWPQERRAVYEVRPSSKL
jgi:hypothetical protein